MLEIVEVKTKKQIKDFLNFPLNLYNKNPYFVPPLYMDEKKMFSKNYVYNETCETVFYNAYEDGKMVGRIQGILQKASNEKWKQKRVRFTRFDAIDKQEVASALFEKIEKWAKEKNMEEVVGPLGYSDLEREGLLIDGFEYLSTYEEQYNYQYYQKLIENCGYEKEIDWLENRLYLPDQDVIDRLDKYYDRILKRYNLHIGTAKNITQFIKKYGDKFFELLDETYNEIYGTVPFSDGMKNVTIENFKMILKVDDVMVLCDENENVVCFGLVIPSISKAVQPSKGHLTIPTIIRILKAKNHPKIYDLGLIGVKKEYALKGVASLCIRQIIEGLRRKGVEFCETNLNLETNTPILNQWKNFKTIQHKRRRSFIKNIKD